MKYTRDDIQRRITSYSADQRRIGAVLIARSRYYDLVDVLETLLAWDPEAQVRSMAAWALDLLGSPETIPALIDGMYDREFSVRSASGWALVHLAQRFIPDLVLAEVIDVLGDEANPKAREMAYLVLSRVQDPRARDAIEQYW